MTTEKTLKAILKQFEDLKKQLNLRSDSKDFEDPLNNKNQNTKTTESIMETKILCNGFSFYKEEIMAMLDKTIREFQYRAHKPQDARLHSSSSDDIFSAISSGNYSKFMDCFTQLS